VTAGELWQLAEGADWVEATLVLPPEPAGPQPWSRGPEPVPGPADGTG
jgi:hypothetical protein